jgi:hypothetical protein
LPLKLSKDACYLEVTTKVYNLVLRLSEPFLGL